MFAQHAFFQDHRFQSVFRHQLLEPRVLTAQRTYLIAIQVRDHGDKLGSDGKSLSHWSDQGAWLEWRLEVATRKRHALLVKYARPGDGRRSVSVDGETIGSVALPSTGGYSAPDLDQWSLAMLRDEAGEPIGIDLTPGPHVLRLTNTDDQGCNPDYVDLLPLGSSD